MSQHHTWRGPLAMCVVGGRTALGALARPRRALWSSRSHRLRPAIAFYEALMGLPALQGARINACDATGQAQECVGLVCGSYVLGQTAAIFEDDHSSFPRWKFAETFFDNTSNAAV